MGSSSTKNPEDENDTNQDIDMKSKEDFIANRIVKAIGNREKNREFEDCSVIVEGKVFSAHSFVLLSCSEFFRSRYRTNIQEEREMVFQLNNISARTFQLILNILYTGENLLRNDNIKDFWNAVHQLQIDSLIRLCENFVVDHLTLYNVAMYKRQADTLCSQRARLGILYFIMKNFYALRNSEVFLNLNMEDLQQVVESDDLLVECEDIVLQAIYRWVGSNENERKKYLADLLQCTRYCLASKLCIESMRKHPFSLNDSRVKEIFDVASAFDIYFMRSFWPTAAIPRNSRGLEHVGVYCNIDDNKFVNISLRGNTVVDFTEIPALKSVKLTIANGKLFACKGNRSTGNIDVFTLEKEHWRLVCGFKLTTTLRKKNTIISMVAQNKRIFVFSNNKMCSFDPNDIQITFEESIYDIIQPQHVINFRSQILLFGYGDKHSGEETTVHSWCTETKTWSYLVDLKFTAKDMASFEDDSNWYILDPNGHFWKLSNSDTVVFTYIGKLWDVTLKLKGALLFKKTVYLFVESLESAVSFNFENDLGKGIFRDVKIHNANVHMSNVVHLVI